MSTTTACACPLDPPRGDRKSPAPADRFVEAAEIVGSLTPARDVLHGSGTPQAGAGAEPVNTGNPEHATVFYLDGEPHRRKRAAIACFFTLKAVATRRRSVMERTTEMLITRLRTDGSARLDQISFELALAVAARTVGSTNSPLRKLAGVSRRLTRLARGNAAKQVASHYIS